MKAICYDNYGPFENLKLREIATPQPKDNEVLIWSKAAGLHIGDCFTVRGNPWLMRVETGFLKPKTGIPGFDVAGIVEATGSKVTRFQPGDEVYGTTHGTCAEFVCASEETLALKPANLTFEQAATVPTSGLAALHALRDVAQVRPGTIVLINGASGGVGSFAVQIAKSMGAEVTGVCSTQSREFVHALGAYHVIDYTADDFTRGDKRYDVIFDNIENRSLSDCRRVLTSDGTLILNSGTGATGFALISRIIAPLILSPFTRQNLRRYLSVPGHADLTELKDLIEAGKLTPMIDKVYPLSETAAALASIEKGHTRGKVAVLV
ncbi:MAG: NAD(P)-dependent alcohol dehydrogenase [Verrucomicrobiales bacterium]|nr:NAD(P)-dependent alcohol dehydrogenase [Verrucomicrobiales bacterium]